MPWRPFRSIAQQRMERGSNFSMMSRNGSSLQAVVGFSTLKLSVALSALTPITFVGGCCTGRKTNYQNLARSPWKRKENARAQLCRGVGRVITDLFENDFARPLTEVN